MKLPRLLAVWFLIFGTSFLFMPQAHANMGLQAYYYDNYTLDNLYNGAPPIPPDMPMVASIPVATVDQDYDLYPLGGLIDDFIVKYEGYITATELATVDLQCLADDGCIVIINGVTIIDEWWDKGTDGGVYQYTLVPNVSLPFTVWYYENGGGAVIQLRWLFPNGEWNVVPEAVFSTVPIANPNPAPSAPAEPSPLPSPTETATLVVETATPVVVPSPEPEPLPSPQETQAVTIVETSTPLSETSTVPSEPVPNEPQPEPVVVIQPQPVVVPPPPEIPEPSPIPEPEEEPAPEPEPEPEAPTVPVEEPPAPVEEPPVEEEQPPVEAEEPPVEAEEPPAEEVPAPVIPEPAPELAPEPPVEKPEPPVVATENSTPEEREAIAETLIEAAGDEPVTAEAIQAAGLTYEDLPDDTPVEVRQDEDGNEVVITAEVAAALVVLESPAALLEAIFTDPAQALLALASIGADMSDEERAESEKIIVASVIAGQAAVTAASAAAAYRRNP